MTRRLLWHVLIAVGACSVRPNRSAELAACRLISKSGDELAKCLVMKYSWGADSAGPAKTAYQWQLDSIRHEHENQAALVLATQLEVERQVALKRLARAARRANIDSIFDACAAQFFQLLVGGNETAYNDGKAKCWRERNERLKRAGFPPEASPPPP